MNKIHPIRARRALAGLTQGELAACLGVKGGATVVSNWERWVKTPNGANRTKMRELIGLTDDDIERICFGDE